MPSSGRDTPAERHPNARHDLGHTEMVNVKLHPDLAAFVDEQAAKHYCSRAEYLRQLIVTAKMNAPEREA